MGAGDTLQRPLLTAIITALRADTLLLEHVDGIFARHSRDEVITPGLYWSLLFGNLEETFEPVILQWDVWTKDRPGKDAVTSGLIAEERMRAVMHRETQFTLGGLPLIAQVDRVSTLAPTEPGWARRLVEWRYQLVRLRAA